jgi:LysR family transcriptional regulator, glycine cleavage system transcriptional activator
MLSFLYRMYMTRFLPSLGSLEAFEATARLGYVSKAAEELNLTQGAVSKLLIGLEARLGVSLFLRRSRQLFLTDAGNTYLSEVQQHLVGLTSATASIIASNGHSGILRVATLPTFGANWLIPRLKSFMRENPGLRVILNSRPEPFDFAFEHFDCAIHFGSSKWPGGIAERIFGENIVAVAAPDLASRVHSICDLNDIPLLNISSRPFAWREWLACVPGEIIEVRTDITVDTFAMALEAVRSGVAATVLPAFLVDADICGGRLKQLLDVKVMSASNYYFVYPDNQHVRPAVRAFGTWIKTKAEYALGAVEIERSTY